MVEQEIIDRVKRELSPSRWRHTQGVVETATILAERYSADVEASRVAAWIHDLAREWPLEKLQQYAEHVEIPSGFALIPDLLHGPIAAVLSRQWFGVNNADVENAIRYHTTGREGMSQLEMVLCLADSIEPSRSYPGVERLRKLAQQDMVQALAEAIDATLQYLLARHEAIFPLTVMARNDLWRQVNHRIVS
ncbi:HD domain-containing protein [Alicyclobacillaceae bacterium I2511]|nr:HD domain-containing protein [Alicyclobacillaceae bacterium I2511]